MSFIQLHAIRADQSVALHLLYALLRMDAKGIILVDITAVGLRYGIVAAGGVGPAPQESAPDPSR